SQAQRIPGSGQVPAKSRQCHLAEKKLAEWESYLTELREQHIRKRRLIEILDGLDEKPIVKKRP
ncbi:MAG: hypothetical protein PVI45_09295, partial [Desulfobacterales bacterium]